MILQHHPPRLLLLLLLLLLLTQALLLNVILESSSEGSGGASKPAASSSSSVEEEEDDDETSPMAAASSSSENDVNQLVITSSLDGSIQAFVRGRVEAKEEEEIPPQTTTAAKSTSTALSPKLLWSNNIGGAIVRSYQAKDSLETGIVVPGDDGSIFLFLGGKLQRFALSVVDFVDHSPMYEELAGGKKLAIVGDKISTIFQLDSSTGSVIRSYDLSVTEGESSFKKSQEEQNQSGSTIMIGREDYRVRAFDVETNQEVWNFTFGKIRPLSGEIISPDELLSSKKKTKKDTSLVTTNPPKGEVPAQDSAVTLRAVGSLTPMKGDVIPYLFLEPEKDEDAKSITIKSISVEDGQQLYAASTESATSYFANPPEGGNMEVSTNVIADSFSMCSMDPNSSNCALLVGSTHSVVPRNSRKVRNSKPPLDLDLTDPGNAQMVSASSNVATETLFGMTLVFGAGLFFANFLRRQHSSQEEEDDATASAKAAVTIGISPSILVNGTTVKVGKLELFMDKIKGHGCNGTIVVEGRLDERPVAVKRMLKTLYVDAGREIDILIRSDGHPNVVRYFSKEESLDFVYLALELCSYTLDNILSRGKGNGVPRSPREATRGFLREICGAVKHLHDLQIVHCDIKPQNILVVPRPNSSANPDELGSCWIPKLSDMGLGRKISDQQSSFTGLHSVRADSDQQFRSSSSSSQGVGTAGWRAPELLLLRGHRSSIENAPTSPVSASDVELSPPLPPKPASRLSRKVDIFSLGCIVYYVIDEGAHPFGAPYEREGRIVKGEHDLTRIEKFEEAHTLISSTLRLDPQRRPTIDICLSHPMLWTDHAKLNFLCEVSDRLEDESQTLISKTPILNKLESRAREVVGPRGWINKLHPLLRHDAEDNKYRSYDPISLRDLLRFIRNKKSHFRDMDEKRQTLLSIPDGFVQEFLTQKSFPNLLIVLYELALRYLSHEKEIARYLGEAAIAAALKEYGPSLAEDTAPQRGWFPGTNDWVESPAVITSSAMKVAPKKFKLMLCSHFERSIGTWCPKGDNCGFAHYPFEIRKAENFVDLSRSPIAQ